MACIHTKKVVIGSFIKARIRNRYQTSGSGSDQKGPDPFLHSISFYKMHPLAVIIKILVYYPFIES
jgi:hypothetical protein